LKLDLLAKNVTLRKNDKKVGMYFGIQKKKLEEGLRAESDSGVCLRGLR